MSLLLKHYSLNRRETVRGWRGASVCSFLLKDKGWRQTPCWRRWENEHEPKRAIKKMNLGVARESNDLLSLTQAAWRGGGQRMETMGVLYESLTHKNITVQWAVLGSHWVNMASLASCSASIQLTRNELLLPLLKARLAGFLDLWLHMRYTSHHPGAPGSTASCFGWLGQADGEQAKPSIFWASLPSPSNIQTALGAPHSQRLTGTQKGVGFKEGEKPGVCISHGGKLCYRIISHWSNLTEGNVNLTQEWQFWAMFYHSVFAQCLVQLGALLHSIRSPCSELNLLGLNSAPWRTSPSFLGQNPLRLLSLHRSGWKHESKYFVLYPLWSPALTALSQHHRALMRGHLPLLLCPAPSHSLLAPLLQPSVLYRPLDVLPLWPSYPNTPGLDMPCLDHFLFDVNCWSRGRKSRHELL